MSVSSYLENLASSLVISSDEKSSIVKSINTLESRLDKYFTNIEDKFCFGSYTRVTILPRKVDENSDIDYMIVFDNTLNYKPQTFLNYLKKFAEYYYATSEIYQSHPTIVLSLNHIKFELVPAYISWSTYYIPAPASNYSDWIITDPNGFNNSLVEKNKTNKYIIKELIRLVKLWNSSNGHIYASFALEKYIIDMYYISCNNLKEYLFDLINSLQTYHLSQTSSNKVNKAKQIVSKVKEYEDNGMPASAELEIKKLFS